MVHTKIFWLLLKEDESNEDYTLACKSYNDEFKMYGTPHIISENDTLEIAQFEGYMDHSLFEVSPNGEFLMLGRINIGWVEGENERFLHDRWDFVLIELAAAENWLTAERSTADIEMKPIDGS